MFKDHGIPCTPDEHLPCHQHTGTAFPDASPAPARCVRVMGVGGEGGQGVNLRGLKQLCPSIHNTLSSSIWVNP